MIVAVRGFVIFVPETLLAAVMARGMPTFEVHRGVRAPLAIAVITVLAILMFALAMVAMPIPIRPTLEMIVGQPLGACLGRTTEEHQAGHNRG